MDFGKILTRAWHISWNNKALWLFGILASCGSQAGFGGSGGNFSADSSSFNGPRNFNMPRGLQQFFLNIERSIQSTTPEAITGIAFAVICFVVLVAIAFFLLSALGRVTVIKGALQADAGQALSVRQLFNDGKPFFVRSLGLNILLGLAIAAFGFAFFVLFLVASVATLGVALICLIPLLCLFPLLGIIYTGYVELANVALVKEDLGVFEAMGRSWELFRANLANVGLMGLILVIGGGILGFVLALPFILVFVPVGIGYFANSGSGLGTGLIISAICLVLAIPVSALLNGILRTFTLSAWALTYNELASPSSTIIDAPPAKPKAPAKAKSPAKPKTPKA
ncbi:MAG: hypothetical protein DWG76_07900 [Chloroflexi bacterium]|nr:hypothetical protein [Chloroflexota bacterium]